MKQRTIISNARDCYVEVSRQDSDPGSWIVNRSKRIFWLKRRVSSNWFIDGPQAFAYANEMKKSHELVLGSARREDMS